MTPRPLRGADATASQPWALALMVASGFAGLGYQLVWTQQSAVWLGHETPAVLAVIGAFFGGLSLGALALGRWIERSPRPVRWAAALEAAIGLWGLVLLVLMAPASRWLLELTGDRPAPGWQWCVAFAGTFLLLLPATAAMGATLPAMERVLAQMRRQGVPIAALYASNTFGAVLGVLAVGFWLVPAIGLTRTAGVAVVLNLLCAVAALVLLRPAAAVVPPRPQPAAPAAAGAGGLLVLLGVTGLLGIGYEVLAVRVISQVAENTVYTFAMLLVVYLVGTALGAAAYQRWLAGPGDGTLLRDRLLGALASACLLGTLAMSFADTAKAALLQALGPGMAAALAAEAALAVAAFLLPTLVMGALFSHLAVQARAAGVAFSRAIGVNTLGAAAAPLLFGVLLVPAIGARAALLLLSAAYLCLASRRGWARPVFRGSGVAALAAAVWVPALTFVDVPEGGRIVSHHEGALAAVSVVEDASGVARLRINNRQQEGSSATLLADARQALLPLLLHPAPRRALFLGLGTGVTASSAAEDPRLQVDAVELLPDVMAASAHFTRGFSGGANGGAESRLHPIAADARRFVRATAQRYDIVVSDNFHPARSGSGALYTVEHFQAVGAVLAPGGLFCQWLPLHQLDLDTLRSIVAAFMAAHPGGMALLATNSLDTPVLGLVARADGGRFDAAQVRQRLQRAGLPRPPADFGIADDLALLGSFVAGPRALAQFAGTAVLNTDDHPVVAYRAPRVTYAADSLPRDRLLALLQALHVTPAEVVDAPAQDLAWAARLAAYWAARDRFIAAGRNVQPAADVRAMLAQVREPLLGVLRASPDFRPAYDPLLAMADALARADAPAARALLQELAAVQPARPEAALALRALSDAP